METTLSEGVTWFSFAATPEKSPGGAHGGWDFFDGSSKQLWVGTGWGANRGKWGLWSTDSGDSSFSGVVEIGKPVILNGQIDFGSPNPGDEQIRLWIGKPEGESLANLNDIRITRIDRVRSFVAPKASYRLSPPVFSSRKPAEGSPAKSPASTIATNKESAEADFVSTVFPLLQEKCLACHGDEPEKIKGDFDMRTREGLLAGGESGEKALVPGKPEESLLYIAATWKDPDFEMPPKENDRLDEKQLRVLHDWIAAGAPWSDRKPSAAGPAGNLGDWSETDADGTVQIVTSGGTSERWTSRRYEADTVWSFQSPENMAPPASGHPIDAFLDQSLTEKGLVPAPRADDRTLNRRLTYSLTGLPPTPKQLVLPFDELLETLLASPHYGERMAQHWLDVTRYADSNGFSRDEERPSAHTYRSYVINSFNADKPYSRFVREQIAGDELDLAGQEALGFLWMGPYEFTLMTSAAVARQMWLDDVVNSVGVTFLGHELRCAKCHDHKFDPIPTRDYYAMQALFASTRHHEKNGSFRIRQQKAQSVSILKGGALGAPTEKVEAGVLSAIGLSHGYDIPKGDKGRRAALANWIASKENPLTARVFVNRLWSWHFGRGIVATPNGFGVMGASPSHPELLDWLSHEFVNRGWSVKELNRLIVTSAAWQRSARHPQQERVVQLDPDGIFLASFKPRRLSAEEIRDSMLAASGELVPRVGGASFNPEINWEVAFQPRLSMGKLLRPWEPSPKKAERHRRSLYAKRMRNLGHPLMEVLNRPPSEFSCEKRDETTVVTQAFSLFHGDFSNNRALALAHRTAETDGMSDRVRAVFDHVVSRPPTADELERSLAHVRRMLVHHKAHKPKKVPLKTKVTPTYVKEETGKEVPVVFQLKKMAAYERDLQPWQVDAETRALAELCLVLLNSSEFLYVY